MRPPFRTRGAMLTPRARIVIGAGLIAGMALSAALSSLDTNPGGEGDPIPPHNERSR